MAFIEETIIGGFISKVISDGIDVSMPAIKTAFNNRLDRNRDRDLSLQVYDVIISSLNTVTHNKYIKNQEAVYKATEYLLKNFKCYDNNSNRSTFRECCFELMYPYSDSIYSEFLKQVHIEISKEKNIELYRQVILKILNEKNLYDQEVIKVLFDKLNQILLLLNGDKNCFANMDMQTNIQQKNLYNIVSDNVGYVNIKNDYMNKTILANYYRGAEAVGGKICFDRMGLTFKSHEFNIQNGKTRIEYNQIQSIHKRSTLGLVPNGISIFTKDGFEHKFVICHREKIIDFLKYKAQII